MSALASERSASFVRSPSKSKSRRTSIVSNRSVASTRSKADTCEHCSQLILELEEDSKCCSCWLKWKGVWGRVPYASCLSCAITVGGLIVVNVTLLKAVSAIDQAFQLINNFEGIYESTRDFILHSTQAVIYSLYVFMFLFVFVAVMASGKNRDILMQIKCLKQNILAMTVICIIVLSIFLVASIVLAVALTAPLTIGKLASLTCIHPNSTYNTFYSLLPDYVKEVLPSDWLIHNNCLDLTFLGANDLLCDEGVIDLFCGCMNDLTDYTLAIVCAMVGSVGGIAMG